MKRLKKTGKPVVLTVNGKAEVVVQDASAYQRLLEEFAKLERDEMRLFLEISRADIEAGRTRPADEVFAELGKKS
jgi:prevent-host-death family protein